MTYTHLDTIADNIGTIGVYDSEHAANHGAAPLRTYRLIATPQPGESMYDALVRTMGSTDEPAAAKLGRISEINAEAMHRIESHWPSWAQRNVALGVYSEPEATACRDWIAAHIAASNDASDAVNAAATVDAVAAVVVTWP